MNVICARCNRPVEAWVSIPVPYSKTMRLFTVKCHGEKSTEKRTVPNYRDRPEGFQITVFVNDA